MFEMEVDEPGRTCMEYLEDRHDDVTNGFKIVVG